MSVENVNLAKQSYEEMTNNGGEVKGYNNVQVAYEDGILTFTEDDGDVHQLTVADLSDAEILQLTKDLNPEEPGDKIQLSNAAKDAGETNAADEKGAVDDAKDAAAEAKDAVAEGTDGVSLADNQAKLDELQSQFDTLDKQAEDLKSKIEDISEDIKADIDELLKQQDEITEDEKARIKTVVDEQLEQFKKDKANGKDVTIEDLRAGIEGAMNDGTFSSEMADLMSKFVLANTKIKSMDTLLNQLSSVNDELNTIDGDISGLKEDIAEQEAAEEAKKAEESEGKKCCDPIGYEAEDGTKYEFVIDEDGNGELSNFGEFLGADENFDEMKALDTDGKNGVTKDELEAANVKVLVTDKDGNQVMKSIDEAFDGKDVNIDTDNFKEAAEGEKAANGQTLLGNFDIKVGDDTHTGYSTLDSAEYLKDNYKFTDENPELAAAPKGADGEPINGLDDENAQVRSDKAAANDQFIETYQDTLRTYEGQMVEIEKIFGFDEDIVESVKNYAEETGVYVGKKVIKQVEDAAKEAEKTNENKNETEEENVDENKGEIKDAGKTEATETDNKVEVPAADDNTELETDIEKKEEEII